MDEEDSFYGEGENYVDEDEGTYLYYKEDGHPALFTDEGLEEDEE